MAKRKVQRGNLSRVREWLDQQPLGRSFTYQDGVDELRGLDISQFSQSIRDCEVRYGWTFERLSARGGGRGQHAPMIFTIVGRPAPDFKPLTVLAAQPGRAKRAYDKDYINARAAKKRAEKAGVTEVDISRLSPESQRAVIEWHEDTTGIPHLSLGSQLVVKGLVLNDDESVSIIAKNHNATYTFRLQGVVSN